MSLTTLTDDDYGCRVFDSVSPSPAGSLATSKRGRSFRMVSFMEIQHLHLSIERYDSQSKQLMESVADIYHPAMVETNSVWWGHSCFLAGAFEVSKPDSYLIIKVSSGVTEEDREELGWTYLSLANSSVDSKMFRLKLFSGNYDQAAFVFNTASPNGTFVDVDFSLVRKCEKNDAASNTPKQRHHRRRYSVLSKNASTNGSSESFMAVPGPATPAKNDAEDGNVTPRSSISPFKQFVTTPPDTIPRSKGDVVLTPSGYSDMSGRFSGRGSPASASNTTTPNHTTTPNYTPSPRGIGKTVSAPNLDVPHAPSGLEPTVMPPLPERTRKVPRSVSARYNAKELQNIVRINTREYVEGVTQPVMFLMRLPPGARAGTVITNLGGRRDRSIVVPADVQAGDVVLIAAVP
jgi:hypothetical protein